MEALIARAVIRELAGDRESVKELCKRYFKKRHLHVAVREIIEAKRETG